ncbi:class I SAM-dependent methyltransferase [Pontibacter silvestris]|uniref:Class I SAM-dependent methyltransferase n=1 Tax=Pontibacter silvestris TaxID=2305183 RepID=A0ABW4WTV3_9BACT|nr:class I SAM-dependent methyltransferase [Pontibacter silvestris]MCC9138578.1 class I SAM-dependent methyltransferase [Pontibacter silvestris]
MPTLPDSGFDRVAPFYDRLARLVFGKALQKAQLALLPHLSPKARVLLIGGGSGWLLEQLLSAHKHLNIYYLEASPAMLKLAEQRYRQYKQQHTCKVTFRVGTEQVLQVQDQFDIIITPFLLDLFPEQRLSQLMKKLNASLVSGGKWFFTDFSPVRQPPPLWQRLLEKSMYHFFRVLSDVKAQEFPDYTRHFQTLKLQQEHQYVFYGSMIQSKVYAKS